MAEMPTDNVGRNLARKMGRDWAHGMAGLKRGGGLLLDALLPPQCLCCGEMVDRYGNLCAPCWSSMRFLEQPCCRACGFPFPHYEVGAMLATELGMAAWICCAPPVPVGGHISTGPARCWPMMSTAGPCCCA